MAKTKTLAALRKIIASLKRKGKRIVFTNGCFDLIHPGHLKVLREAKRKGDLLVVGLNSDSSIKKIKGANRPILKQKARIEVLEHLDLIDYIVVFSEPTPLKIIKTLKPHFLVKGGDWSEKDIVGNKIVEQVYRVKLKPGYSTTAIIAAIKERC